MGQRDIVAGAVVLGLVIAGVGATVAGLGPAAGIWGNEESQTPALTSFTSAGANCTTDFIANSSTSVVVSGPDTQVTHTQNISLPDPSYAVGSPTFERLNESAYILSVPVEETEKEPRDCSGVARYNASMRIPAGEDPWQIIINHDGENVTTRYGDSDSSFMGGSASSGGSSSTDGNTTRSE